MSHPYTILLVGLVLASWATLIAVIVYWARTLPYIPEDEAAEFDAGVHRVCFSCGRHISGPRNGTRQADCQCFDCWAKTPASDDGAVPSYVHHHHEPVTTPRNDSRLRPPPSPPATRPRPFAAKSLRR